MHNMRDRSFPILLPLFLLILLCACKPYSTEKTRTSGVFFGTSTINIPTETPNPLSPALPTPSIERTADLMPSPSSKLSGNTGELYLIFRDAKEKKNLIKYIPADCLTLNIDCSEPQEISNGYPNNLGSFSWSPDGLKGAAVYRSPDDGWAELYVYEPANNSWRILVNRSLYINNLAWSSDSQWIAFEGSRQKEISQYDLYVIHPDGSDLTNLSNYSLANLHLGGWIGDAIYFTAGQEESETTYRIRIGDLKPQQLNPNIFGLHNLLPSPDGHHIAFLNSNSKSLSLMKPEGEFEHLLLTLEDEYKVNNLVWSPDSHWLAIILVSMSNERTDNRIGLIDIQGGTPRLAYQAPIVGDIFFTPDSKSLIIHVIPSSGLVRIDVKGGYPRSIAIPGNNPGMMGISWRIFHY